VVHDYGIVFKGNNNLKSYNNDDDRKSESESDFKEAVAATGRKSRYCVIIIFM